MFTTWIHGYLGKVYLLFKFWNKSFVWCYWISKSSKFVSKRKYTTYSASFKNTILERIFPPNEIQHQFGSTKQTWSTWSFEMFKPVCPFSILTNISIDTNFAFFCLFRKRITKNFLAVLKNEFQIKQFYFLFWSYRDVADVLKNTAKMTQGQSR